MVLTEAIVKQTCTWYGLSFMVLICGSYQYANNIIMSKEKKTVKWKICILDLNFFLNLKINAFK